MIQSRGPFDIVTISLAIYNCVDTLSAQRLGSAYCEESRLVPHKVIVDLVVAMNSQLRRLRCRVSYAKRRI